MRKNNCRPIARAKRSMRAISPVIATLLMIAIAVVAALVTYTWVMGYMGLTTSKISKTLQIQSITIDPAGKLIVYVQNVGTGSLEFDPSSCAFVNDVLKTCTINAGSNPLNEGQTTPLKVDFNAVPGSTIKVKIVAVTGTYAEGTSSIAQTSAASVQLTIVLEDGFENGFSAWNPGPVNSPSIVSGNAYSGTYAMQPTAGESVARETISAASTVNVRTYVMFTSLPTQEYVAVGLVTLFDSSWQPAAQILVQKSNGNMQWGLNFNGLTGPTDWHSANIQTGHWYSLQIYYQASTGANSEKSYWIDGSLIATSKTQTDTARIANVDVGFTTSGLPANIAALFDDVQISSS